MIIIKMNISRVNNVFVTFWPCKVYQRQISESNPKKIPFLTYKTEFILFLAMLENSILPMG